tara:strand:- start:1122 stop:1382 length:261 start_codon:yes stop_codon:yes gene_type:complete
MFDKSELWVQLEDHECLLADGFDDAVVGITFGVEPKTVYSVTKCLDILVEEGMSMEDAIEHFEYNVAGSYVGEKTPVWVYDFDISE